MRSFDEWLKERDEDLYKEFDIRLPSMKKMGLAAAMGLGGLGLGLSPGGYGGQSDSPTPMVQPAAEMSPEEMVKSVHGFSDHEIEQSKRDHTFDHYHKQAVRELRNK